MAGNWAGIAAKMAVDTPAGFGQNRTMLGEPEKQLSLMRLNALGLKVAAKVKKKC